MLQKILRGIKEQINQAAAGFRSIQQAPQNEEDFVGWYLYAKDQAEQCTGPGYGAGVMTKNTMQLQAKGSKLQQKRLPENLNYAKTTKHGLAPEQRERKADRTIPCTERPEDTRVMAL